MGFRGYMALHGDIFIHICIICMCIRYTHRYKGYTGICRENAHPAGRGALGICNQQAGAYRCLNGLSGSGGVNMGRL